MNIEIVMQELDRMRTEFNINAYESGDPNTEKFWADRVEILAQALEYLWQYEDLME